MTAVLAGLIVHADTRATKEQPIQLVQNDKERRVDVLVDGQPFTSYIYPTTLKKPVLYPLRTAKGTVVTRGYPMDPRPAERVDHPHHVGLWFNYGNVNGFDFWNNSDAVKQTKEHPYGTIYHRGITTLKSGKEGELGVTMDWKDADGKQLLSETTQFIFRASPGLRVIDRITKLTALDQTVRFTDDKEGVIGMRVARSLEHPSNKPEVFTDASGKTTNVPKLDNTGVTGQYLSSEGIKGEAVWGTRGRWMILTGTVDGEAVTLAILDHPKNPGYPTYWHARGYGLFAANPLGQAALSNGKETLNFTLKTNESTTFRYRILIISGTATADQIEAQYKQFIKDVQ
jgi:hypothetical protein